MRIMSLDIGDRTVGIAISDELLWTAQGIETIRRKSYKHDLGRIRELSKKYEVEKFVVGFPKNMDGTVGERCDIVKHFTEKLREDFPDAEIIFWDERLSTVGATHALLEADVSRAKRKKVIDKMAAVFILQGYLDSLR